jgi:hypothetical protein
MGLVNSLCSLCLRHSIENLFGEDGYEKTVMKINGLTIFVYTVDLDSLEKWYFTKNEAQAIQLESMLINCGYAYSSANVVVLSKHINKRDRDVFMWHEIGHVVNKHSKVKLSHLIRVCINKHPEIIINGEWEKLADKMAYLHTGVKITPMYLWDVVKTTALNYLGDAEAVAEAFSPEKQQTVVNRLMQDERFK